jgi:cobalt-zinc-cadmium efflux system protein
VRHAGSAAARSHGRLVVVLGVTLVYVAIEVAGGLYTHTLALVADAGHLFMDALGLGMAPVSG